MAIGGANSQRVLVFRPMATSDCTIVVAAATPSTTGTPIARLIAGGQVGHPGAAENDDVAAVLGDRAGAFRGDHRRARRSRDLQVQHGDLAGPHVAAGACDAVVRGQIPGPADGPLAGW